MAQKLAPAEKNSTDISAASATFCISVEEWNKVELERPQQQRDIYCDCFIDRQTNRHAPILDVEVDFSIQII